MEASSYPEIYGRAPYAVSIIDLEGRFLYANPPYESLLGYCPGELIGGGVDRVHSDRNREGLGLQILEATMRGDGWSGRIWNRTKAGVDLWIDLDTQLLRDSRGEPIGIAGWAREVPQTMGERFMAALSAASALVTRRMDADTLLQEMNLLLRRGLDLDRAGIWRKDGDLLRGTWGTDEYGQLKDERDDVEGNPECDLVHVSRGGQAYSSVDRLQIVLPIAVNGQLIGVLSVDNRIHRKPIPPEMLKPLSLFADYVGIGLRNVRLRAEIETATEDLRRRAAELQSLLEIGRNLVQEWVPERLFQEITQCASELLDAPCIDLFRREGNDLRHLAGSRLDSDENVVPFRMAENEQSWPMRLSPFVERSILAGEPVVVQGMEDASLEPGEIEWGWEHGIHARISVPIPGVEEAQGALVILENRRPRCFSEEEVQLASYLAASIGVAIRNAERIAETERLNRELRLALSLERDLAEERSRSDRLEGVLQTVRMVHHEVNNPLQVVVGNAQLLELRLSQDPAAVRLLGRLLEGCTRITDVSSRLARVVRAASRPSPVGEMLDLSEAVHRSEATHRSES